MYITKKVMDTASRLSGHIVLRSSDYYLQTESEPRVLLLTSFFCTIVISNTVKASNLGRCENSQRSPGKTFSSLS
jgi:hypothetical protein